MRRTTPFAFFVAAVALIATLQFAVGQSPLTPEQQKLIDQIKSQGFPPTPAQIQQLQDMAKGFSQHLGSAAGTKIIPCVVSVTMNYRFTPKNTNGSTTVNMVGRSLGNMTAIINGNADYTKNMQGAGASIFTIAPVIPVSGTGNVTKHSDVASEDQNGGTTHATDDWTGQISQGSAGLSMMTTGGDALYGHSSFNGHILGTHRWDHPGSNHNEPWDISTNWDVPPGFTAESLQKTVPGTALPAPQLILSYKTLVKGIQSGQVTTLSGAEHFHIELASGTYEGDSTLSITLNPKAVQLVLEPDNESTYEKWLPLPGTDDNKGFNFQNATPMNVHVVLNDQFKPGAAGGAKTKPNTSVAGRFDISLQNVSNNPGVCMNFPANGAAKPGLYFPKTQPAGIVYDDETHVHTAPLVEANVLVNVRDTGAYGQIVATCSSLNLTSTVLRTNKKELNIPMDDNNNHIADYWEANNVVPSKDPGWDACEKPSGMMTGDGISLYDKYRGLLLDDGSGNEVFSRVDPTVKNLFIYLPAPGDQSLIKAGCRLFMETTAIKVSYLHSGDRAQVVAGSTYPRWITFNSTPYTQTKQCAVIILDDGKPWDILPQGGRHEFVGTTIGLDMSEAGQLARHDPTMEDHIVVRLRAAKNQVSTWVNLFPPQNTQSGSDPGLIAAINKVTKTMGLDPFAVGHYAQTNTSALVTELMIFSVCHELGHETGAVHHEPSTGGDPNCPMCYWQQDPALISLVSFLAGKWDPSAAALKGKWKFGSEDWPQMRIKPQ